VPSALPFFLGVPITCLPFACSQVIGTKKQGKAKGIITPPISRGLSFFFGAMKRILAIRDRKKDEHIKAPQWGCYQLRFLFREKITKKRQRF